MMNSQARRLEPGCKRCCFSSARTKLLCTRSSALAVLRLKARVTSQSRNFAFQESAKLVHLNLHSGGRRPSPLGRKGSDEPRLICQRNPRMNQEFHRGKML